MPTKFLITGLPRSRTAWLAAILSTEKILCWHEPINKFGSVGAVKAMLDNLEGYQAIGISDSSVGLEADFYMAYFYEYPIVIINRKESEVITSLSKFLGIDKKQSIKIVDTISEGLERMRKVRAVMEIDYNDLNDSTIVEGIWNYCTNEMPFDFFRCELFQNLLINQHAAKVITAMDIEGDIKKHQN